MQDICEQCEKYFRPREAKAIRILKEFNGFTVDLKLKQFRKAKFGEELVFIEFDSDKGQKLLILIHKKVITRT